MNKFVFIAGQRKTLQVAFWKMGTFTQSYPFFSKSLKPNFFNFRDGVNAEYWVPEKEIIVMNTLGRKYLNVSFTRKIIQDIINHNKVAWNLIGRITTEDFSQKKPKELLTLFNQCDAVLYRLMGTLFLSQEVYTKAVEDRLMEALQKRLNSVNKANTYFNLLIKPDTLDGIKHEEIQWYKYVIQSKKINKADLLDYLYRNSWLVYNAFTNNEAYKFINERYIRSKKNVRTYFYSLKKLKKEKAKEQARISRSLRIFDKKTLQLAQIIKDLAKTRLEVKFATNTLETTMNLRLLQFVAAKNHIIFLDLIDGYFPDDIRNVLRKKILVPKAEIQRRKRFVSFYYHRGRVQIATGVAAKKLTQRILKNSLPTKTITVLKGQAASQGKNPVITGKARIIRLGSHEQLAEDMRRFKAGEIIVSMMTQPQIMPIARKSAGIITDEGGICSHAAIISRELSIPCVVGTAVATKIIHDGDLVTIDARKGIVHLLKK
ncbi:MAG: PEP-utilizing enzyme [bacterium]|nr:PEP-utilizing enzyme [bacterium]